MARDLLAPRKGRDLLEEKPSTASDIGQSLLTGVRQSLEGMAALPGNLRELGGEGAEWIADKFGASPVTRETVGKVVRMATMYPTAPTQEQIVEVGTNPVLGQAYQPQTTPGEYARTIGQFAPAALTGGGSLAGRVAGQVVLPALASETAGQLTEGTKYEPYARLGGAVAGGMAGPMLRRAVTPFPTDPARQRMVEALQRNNVPMSAGQKTGNEALQYAESELGRGASRRLMDSQGEAFSKAVLKGAGVNAKRALPDVLDDAFSAAGKQFDDIAARNSITPEPTLFQNLRSVIDDYVDNVAASDRSAAVQKTVSDIAAKLQTGQLSGRAYQDVTSSLFRRAKSAKGETKQALFGIRNALDDAMERQLTAKRSPDLGKWQELRNQYKNLLVAEDSVSGAGADAAMGLITPGKLRTAVAKQGKRNYVRGRGDMAELARAGQAVLRPLPQSGTAPRVAAQTLGTGIPAAVGAIAGSGAAGAPGAVAGALLGASAPRAAGAALMSRPGQAYLSNQVLPQSMSTITPTQRALIAALLSRQASPPVNQPR